MIAWRALAIGFVVSAVLGALARPLARRLGVVSQPRPGRMPQGRVPLLGGAAVLGGAGAGALASGGAAIGSQAIAALVAITCIAAVGLADDLFALRARTRVAWPAVAGSVAWFLGLRVDLVPGAADPVDALLTVAWFVAVTHAMNVLDNADGAAGGVAGLSAGALALLACARGQWTVAAAAAGLAGASTAFLLHNRAPARLFLGDFGSLGMGFTLAALALALRPPQAPPVGAAVPVLLLAVPLLDAVMVTVARVRAGRPVTVGGTDHTAHRLVARGASVAGAAGVLWAAQLVFAACAVGVALGPRAWAWAVTIGAGALGLGAVAAVLRLAALEAAVSDPPAVPVEPAAR